MSVRYRSTKDGLAPEYVCQREGIERAAPSCQRIPGTKIDKAIGQLLLDMITPVTLDVAMEVQHQLQSQLDQADRLRHQQVERARYEAELAQQRYMQVDPNNRLVADTLEADWNAKLRALDEAQQQYDQQRRADRAILDEKQREDIRALASDFPRLWNDKGTPPRERKRMVRLLIEDVTLIRTEQLGVHIRFRGGATRSLTMPIPLPACKSWQTDPTVVAEIDRLLNDFPSAQIAEQLNERGLRSGKGGHFKRMTIVNICQSYGLKSRYQRLREAGKLTRDEVAQQLGITNSTVRSWRIHGLLKAYDCGERKYLYEPLGQDRPVKSQGRKLSDRQQVHKAASNDMKEV